jgi:hypothetical protein
MRKTRKHNKRTKAGRSSGCYINNIYSADLDQDGKFHKSKNVPGYLSRLFTFTKLLTRRHKLRQTDIGGPEKNSMSFFCNKMKITFTNPNIEKVDECPCGFKGADTTKKLNSRWSGILLGLKTNIIIDISHYDSPAHFVASVLTKKSMFRSKSKEQQLIEALIGEELTQPKRRELFSHDRSNFTLPNCTILLGFHHTSHKKHFIKILNIDRETRRKGHKGIHSYPSLTNNAIHNISPSPSASMAARSVHPRQTVRSMHPRQTVRSMHPNRAVSRKLRTPVAEAIARGQPNRKIGWF